MAKITKGGGAAKAKGAKAQKSAEGVKAEKPEKPGKPAAAKRVRKDEPRVTAEKGGERTKRRSHPANPPAPAPDAEHRLADPAGILFTTDTPLPPPTSIATKVAERAQAAAERLEEHDAKGVTYRDLACALTPEEVAKKADELSACIGRRHELDEERREYANRSRADLKALQGQGEMLAEQIRQRSEDRPVACKTVQDSERKKVAVFRTDTMECLDVRDMTESEAAICREEQGRGKAKQLGGDVIAAILKWEEGRGKAAIGRVVTGAAERAALAKTPDFNLRDIAGVGAQVATALREHGYGTIQAIRDAVEADLVKVPGVGSLLAQRILLYVEENYPASPVMTHPAYLPAEDAPERPTGLAAAQAASNLRAAAAEDDAEAEEGEEAYQERMAVQAGELSDFDQHIVQDLVGAIDDPDADVSQEIADFDKIFDGG